MFSEDDLHDSADDFLTEVSLDHEWQPILQASNQVVLYNPTSHALSVQQRTPPASTPGGLVKLDKQSSRTCPYCHRSLVQEGMSEDAHEDTDEFLDDHPRSRAPNYFQLLQISNENASVPSTPLSSTPRRSTTPVPHEEEEVPFKASSMAEGYFEAFFQEECRLGMGANGSVFLCRHVLNGNPLGHFAVKKIAVGQSPAYLLNILREVRLLEKLHHPNIITYHHAWLETAQFSSFGPKVPTLHVLMQWAEGGSLDDFIDARQGKPSSAAQIYHVHPNSSTAQPQRDSQEDLNTAASNAPYSRGARIRAFRAMQRAPPEERERLQRELAGQGLAPGRSSSDMKAVHLLSAEEVKSLFQDVVEGLAFLHDKSILHLDLKPGNVLLTWDDGKLIPRAMLSDFGTSQDMLNSRARSGNTGTLEYASPESLPSPSGQLSQVDSKSDMWSLGMILHKLLFFRLPYHYASDTPRSDSRMDGKEISDLLEREVHEYPGFKRDTTIITAFDSRHLPRALLLLLESLLNKKPAARPSSERVLIAVREGKLDPTPKRSSSGNAGNASGGFLVPVKHVFNRDTQVDGPSGSQAFVEGPSELPQWTETTKEDSTQTIDEYRAPIRNLPALPAPAIPEHVPWATLRVWNRDYHLNAISARIIFKRTVKSSLLVYKVWSLLRIPPTTPIGSTITAMAITLAIMDTWFDGLAESAVLLLAHLGFIEFALRRTR